ncbi:MAG: hypothetical protein DRQ98_12515 [Gammaproteobacteria bacterium]|nr:MAG: hypothetical protein DRQ98_12515 [Gammaproteobacteria bacterium]
MPVLMSKEEIAFTIQLTRDRNNATHDAHYDRVLDRMCNYVEANLDDFMECYDVEVDEAGVTHIRDKS